MLELKGQVIVQYLQTEASEHCTHQASIAAACEHRALESGTPGQARDARGVMDLTLCLLKDSLQKGCNRENFNYKA